jgi:hypothetical protein
MTSEEEAKEMGWMRFRSFAVVLCVAVAVVVPASMARAGAPPPGGCPDGFTLHDANENPDWPQHKDRNGEGRLCVKTNGGGGDIVIDNR